MSRHWKYHGGEEVFYTYLDTCSIPTIEKYIVEYAQEDREHNYLYKLRGNGWWPENVLTNNLIEAKQMLKILLEQNLEIKLENLNKLQYKDL